MLDNYVGMQELVLLNRFFEKQVVLLEGAHHTRLRIINRPVYANRNPGATSSHSSLNDVSIINVPHSATALFQSRKNCISVVVIPMILVPKINRRLLNWYGGTNGIRAGSVERELFCVFKISIVFGRGNRIGNWLGGVVLEILSQCLFRGWFGKPMCYAAFRSFVWLMELANICEALGPILLLLCFGLKAGNNW